jgi:hypothetical protein
MADSHDTRIASAIPQHTRRALVAGLALAPIAGLPAVAGAPMSQALAQAIQRHKAALAAFDFIGDTDAEVDAAGDVARAALFDLATLSCVSDAELIQKLRYLIEYERECLEEPSFFDAFGPVAVDLHLNPEATS